MRSSQYKTFSLQLHQKKWRKSKPSVCQFELTFSCPLHCAHCYSDCRNNPQAIKKELKMKEALYILNKIYNSGALWLCFTGGDPLARRDFLEIYAAAREKGFMVTIFTSGVLITRETADYFEKAPPFCIELTLNGISKETYERISGVEGSFEKVMAGIDLLKKRRIPFKIKTMATIQNLHELGKLKDFVQGLGLRFRPSSMLFARLNGDSMPCQLRVSPTEVIEIDERFKTNSMEEEGLAEDKEPPLGANKTLFRCAAGSDTFHVDPYGRMFLCSTVRRPAINLLTAEIENGLKIFQDIKKKEFKTNSQCRDCAIWHLCHRCPGRASLEAGDPEAPIDYFCQLAHLAAKKYAKNQA